MNEYVEPSSEGTGAACLPPHLRAPRLRRDAAVEYLALVHGIQLSKDTLAKWACKGGKWAGKIGGPPFNKTVGGTPLYPRGGLDEWAVKYLGPLVRTTSE